MLSLHCCEGFSLVVEGELLSRRGARVSRCSGPSGCGAQAPGPVGSVVLAPGLSSCGAWA